MPKHQRKRHSFTVKSLYRIIQLWVLMATVICSVGTVNASLTLTPDRVAVYDSQSGLFWYANLSYFNPYTYSEQIDAIADLPGTWHMATLSEYESLALNSEQQIYKTFNRTTDTYLSYETPNDTLIYIYLGRINEPLGPSASGTHYSASMNYDVTHDVILSPLQINTDWHDDWSGGTSAWVVTDSYSSGPILTGWTGGLVQFDIQTGAYTTMLNAPGLQIEALAFDSYDRILYGVVNGENSLLARIDWEQGVIANIGVITGFNEITSITFDDTTATIFALDQTTRTLLSIDPITASPTVIGNYSYGSSNALAANPITGELFMSLMGLFGSINKTTGQFTLIGNTGLNVITGLDFLPDTQILYGIGQTMGGGYQLFTLDLETGTPSFIGEPNLPQITSIEFIEPSLPVTLTVTIDGNGWGNLSASGLTCNSNICNGTYNYGTIVTITATPDTGSLFDSWSGCDSTNANLCIVSMARDKSVTATFTLNNYSLTATKTGSGSGTLAAPGLSCISNTCTGSYPYNTPVTITATPVSGSSFGGWTGCDSTSSNTCSVTMTSNKSVSAAFTLNQYTLTVEKSGTGTGNINGLGISCGIDCMENYSYGTVVTLTATADTGSVFAGWSGCDTAVDNVCAVLVNGNRNITATFYLEYTLLVNLEGTGDGRVVSTPSGIDCEPTCNDTFLAGTPVTLKAYPYGGSAFAYWSGECTGTTDTCNITMTGYIEVTAHFVSDETKEYKLTVGKKHINKGDGLVQSNDGTISCGDVCTGLYYPNTPITLRATPSPGSLFEGWSPTSSNCGTSPTCSFTMNSNTKVKAIFRGPYRLLTKIKVKKDGSGSVSADISGIGTGINCPASSCEDHYPYGNNVVLTAQPGGGSQFMGWKPSSLQCGTSLTCTVPMTKKWSVTATFEGM